MSGTARSPLWRLGCRTVVRFWVAACGAASSTATMDNSIRPMRNIRVGESPKAAL